MDNDLTPESNFLDFYHRTNTLVYYGGVKLAATFLTYPAATRK
jgi:hypothetical protein